MDGQVLTPDELKFLAISNVSLIQFVSKKRYQQYLDILDPEIIEKVS
jgi:hypothetical protein